MSSRKGDRWERNYVNALSASDPDDDRKHVERVGIDDFAFVGGFTALRLPASGAGRDADLPDIHVWLRVDGEIYQFAAEAKAGATGVRLSNGEVAALRRYAESTGAAPVAFIHIDKDTSGEDRLGGDYVVHVDDLHSTDKGFTFTRRRDGGGAEVCTGTPFGEWVTQPTKL